MMGFRAEQAKQKGQRARRLWKRVPLSRISPYLIQAVLIAEDDKFFEHEGFDWESMRNALEANIKKKRGSAAAARPSPSSWPRTCSSAPSRASGASCAKRPSPGSWKGN